MEPVDPSFAKGRRSGLLHGTRNLVRPLLEAVASAAAIVSLVLLIVVPLNTYANEGVERVDEIVVLALATVGYLSPKGVFRCLAVFVALGSLYEIYSTYRLHTHPWP